MKKTITTTYTWEESDIVPGAEFVDPDSKEVVKVLYADGDSEPCYILFNLATYRVSTALVKHELLNFLNDKNYSPSQRQPKSLNAVTDPIDELSKSSRSLDEVQRGDFVTFHGQLHLIVLTPPERWLLIHLMTGPSMGLIAYDTLSKEGLIDHLIKHEAVILQNGVSVVLTQPTR